MLNFCLIGAGRIGKVHSLAVNNVAGAKIAYVVDAYQKNAEELAKTLDAKVLTEDQAFSLEYTDKIDAYIIASSTNTHTPLILRCVDVKKPVFCEKPVDLNYETAKACAEKVHAAGIPCMLGFNRRFDPQFTLLKEEMKAGKIGQLETLIITSRDPSPPPVEYIGVSGGLFRDMMIHDFDMARFLLGEEPTKVYATGSVMVDPAIGKAGDIDTASVTLSTKSGAICVITNSRRAAYGYDQRIESFGEKGMLQAGNKLENTVSFLGEFGSNAAKPQFFFLERYADAYRIELEAFVKALQDGTPTPTTIDDGLKALALAEAALKSYQTGTVVEL